jgi:hypothetical protein
MRSKGSAALRVLSIQFHRLQGSLRGEQSERLLTPRRYQGRTYSFVTIWLKTLLPLAPGLLHHHPLEWWEEGKRFQVSLVHF